MPKRVIHLMLESCMHDALCYVLSESLSDHSSPCVYKSITISCDAVFMAVYFRPVVSSIPIFYSCLLSAYKILFAFYSLHLVCLFQFHSAVFYSARHLLSQLRDASSATPFFSVKGHLWRELHYPEH